MKNSTAEIAEHAEAKITNNLSGKDLCALCFLFVHPLVSIPGGSKESISTK
jgi:hypothetical protein